MERRFKEGRRVLSFQQYLELFAAEPVRYGRDAARYVRDRLEHFGNYTVKKPWGELVRYRLFDLPWDPEAAGAKRRHRGRDASLVGHEELQAEIYRGLCNFVQEGRANRLILMHGPNGSAKSTVAACVLRALEHYSTLDEGALYRFHWVFPSRTAMRRSIGSGGDGKVSRGAGVSYADLQDDQIDARLVIELRDHPLFLLPLHERRELLRKLYQGGGEPPDWLMSGKLSHKNQQVFEALLTSYAG